MKLSIAAFEANGEDSTEKQVNGCMDQLKEFISERSLRISNIIALNFFVLAESNEEYYTRRDKVAACLPEEVQKNIPIAYLAQAPADGKKVSVEMHYIAELNDTNVSLKRVNGSHYRVLSNERGEKLVVANGISVQRTEHNILEDSEYVFGIMEEILLAEGLHFNDIFRQWNYIEGIVEREQDKDVESQHYQQFNNVRSRYYAKAEFVNGYPAATGIGTRAGGVIVSFYAASHTGLAVFAVENPLQRAAFDYTEEVLVGNDEYEGFKKCTPKFARAKFVENAASKQVYISGTASIREEKTIAEDDVVQQTVVTIENIEQLISKESIEVLKVQGFRQ